MSGRAEALNRECRCVAVDLARLRSEIERELEARGLAAALVDSHPHLFSSLPVFVSPEQLGRMAQIVAAVESVAALPAYRDHVLAWGPDTARHDPGPLGVFLGYDFHIGAAGPQLIEINTNAGGAALNLLLSRVQRACCVETAPLFGEAGDVAALEEELWAMFVSEWRRQRGGAALGRIAIVDDAPREQYLYPEFLLFQRLLERHGVGCAIADARSLELRGGRLRDAGGPIDLVYNRLTDFALALPEHAALCQAWLEGSAVVTPHPRAHALYADKRNLAALTDPALLRGWGVAEGVAAVLQAGIPRTVLVNAAEALWSRRKELFFKPAAGFGSRGSYRGDKLTRRVFAEILAGGYVAQALVPPSERSGAGAEMPPALKLDLRNYVYEGKVQFVAARLYRGQTTNFRTPGGGFAPVFLPAA